VRVQAASDQAASDPASPLGRYAVPGDDVVEVRLLGTPLELLVSAREHHDGLMREFRLLALAGPSAERPVPVRLVELTEILGCQYGAASARRDAEVDRALATGELTIDLVFQVPRAAAAAAQGLAELMDEADAFCAAEQLMTTARPALLTQVGNWYLEQFITQCAGGAAVAWDGPVVLDV